MNYNAVSCFIALTLVTLVYGTKRDQLLGLGFEYFPGVGYYYFGTDRNWTYAQHNCMSSKGRLAVINSEVERQTIVSFLSNNTQDEYVYAGFTNENEVQYVTTEGLPIKKTGYANWETGKPSSYSQRCGGINTKTGELTDLPCEVAASFVCENQLWTDYTYIKGVGYYKLHTEGKGWADAYDICESEGAHLLIINSQAEADAVMQIYDEHPDLPYADASDVVYVGFRVVIDMVAENSYDNTYLTIFGESVSNLGYVKWYGKEPDVYYNHCGTLVRTEASYMMHGCNMHYAFFCEKELQDFNRT